MTDYADVDRRTLYVNVWSLWRNPIYARIFIKYLLAQPVNFKSERYDETRVLTLRTRQISNLLSSMLLKLSAFQCAVYTINVSITNAFPPESWETPVQHQLFQYNGQVRLGSLVRNYFSVRTILNSTGCCK